MIHQATSVRPVPRGADWNLKARSAPGQAPTYKLQEPEEPNPRYAGGVSNPGLLHTALVAGMDKLSHGVAVLDTEGHAHYANAAARTLFSRLGWPRCESGRAKTPADWAPTLQQVCQRGRRGLRRIAVKDCAMVVVLVPLTIAGGEFAFAVFGREELCGSVELQMFALHHQLTHAETLVLRQLTRGLNASAIAVEHGVACNTVLTQIAAIRSKTSCNSVRSLLEMLARMPPMRPLQPVADAH